MPQRSRCTPPAAKRVPWTVVSGRSSRTAVVSDRCRLGSLSDSLSTPGASKRRLSADADRSADALSSSVRCCRCNTRSIRQIVVRSALFRGSTCCVDHARFGYMPLMLVCRRLRGSQFGEALFPRELHPGLNWRAASGPISATEANLSAAIIQALFLRGGMPSANGKSAGFQPFIARSGARLPPVPHHPDRASPPRRQGFGPRLKWPRYRPSDRPRFRQ